MARNTSPDEADRPQIDLPEIVPPPVTLRAITLVPWGIAAWAVALLVILLVPSLRDGDRSWVAWVPVAGMTLGALGYVYLRRGRGNAADA